MKYKAKVLLLFLPALIIGLIGLIVWFIKASFLVGYHHQLRCYEYEKSFDERT